MQKLLVNIKELFQVRASSEQPVYGLDMKDLPSIKNAWLLIENGCIADFGEMNSLPALSCEQLDAKGGYVLPTWVDCHTHIVFAASREEEFVMKIQGKSYEEIAASGGGILNSARKLAGAREEDLYEDAAKRLKQLIALGTGAIEIKSGYGLSLEAELKMLRVIKKLKENFALPIKANLLAAHAIPREYGSNRNAYIQLIVDEIIPAAAKEGLADFVDAFCEKGFFSPEETDFILKTGKSYGLRAKIHANQLSISGGVQVGVANDAISVDHLEEIGEEELLSLQASRTIPVALPSCSFYLGIPFAPVRKMMNANLPVAIASDYNPGSSPSGNMNFLHSLACIKLKMLPREAINAATINAAFAMGVEKEVGSITKGKLANLILTKELPSLEYLAYSFGENCISKVLLKGEIF
ncbi:MAG: imidazolonepropionase [Chitinophagales bacterium]|nr:imidazolonepropionase [Chitinophagales bacterium]